ncbi:MAG: DUF3185 domain-containing protein [Kiritimatiellae bacterium]|nr:DUF3185 domain-containing protein [Kiritimatiellia bacterium]MDD4736789.1 DUF3185 domain-containing protein [Kiritimatiellia bacterium]
MNLRKILSLILITLGVVVLVYSGITFRMPGKPINMGPIHIETTTTHFISPVAGAVVLVGGIVLWFVGMPWQKEN